MSDIDNIQDVGTEIENNIGEHDFNDFDGGNLLLEDGQEEQAFEVFLRFTQKENVDEEKRNEAIDKLIEIAKKNEFNKQFIDFTTWEQIEELSKKDGCEYALLLMHFKYSISGKEELAYKYLNDYFEKQKGNLSPIAYLQKGICYRWGIGVEMDENKAKENYNKAIEEGCSIAYKALGNLYFWEGRNIEKNLDTAEKLFELGKDKGDRSCYERLFDLYKEKREKEKAMELAQEMIDKNIKGGYCLMGDYYYSICNDTTKAKYWYEEAIKRKEKEAFGSLAAINWLDGNHDKAFLLAHKGCSENNGQSFQLLGYFYMESHNWTAAWETFQHYFEFFNAPFAAFQMGNLYLDGKKELNENGLNTLKYNLERSANLPDADAIKCFLRLILKEEKGIKATEINHDNIKYIPKEYLYLLELGVKNEKNGGLLYAYGRFLIENTAGALGNREKGLKYVERAAKANCKDAKQFVFDNFKLFGLLKHDLIINDKRYVGLETMDVINNFKGDKNDIFLDWLYNSLRILVYEDTDAFSDCFAIFRNIIEKNRFNGNVEKWLCDQVQAFQSDFDDTAILMTPFYAYLLAAQLSVEGKNDDKGDSVLPFVRNVVDIENNTLFVSKIPYFKDYIQLIWPDFSEEKILINGDLSNERDIRILYGLKNPSISDLMMDSSEIVPAINSFLGEFVERVDLHGIDCTKAKVFYRAYYAMHLRYTKLKIKGLAEDVESDSTSTISSPVVCCSIEDTLTYCLDSFKMLIASKEAFGQEIWKEIVANLDNVDCFPKIAENINDDDARALLENYYSLTNERDKLLHFDTKIEYGSTEDIVETINTAIDYLDHLKIYTGEKKHITVDDLPASITELKESMKEFKDVLIDYLFP